jgi:hypothetical protein
MKECAKIMLGVIAVLMMLALTTCAVTDLETRVGSNAGLVNVMTSRK